jgi:hypothetical protein
MKKIALNTREWMWFSDGKEFASGRPIGYRADLPELQLVILINEFGPNHGGWKTLRITNGSVGEWQGEFETPHAAVESLERELNAA